MTDQGASACKGPAPSKRPWVTRQAWSDDVMAMHYWHVWRLSWLSCKFSFGGFVRSLHLGRLAVAVGGEDPITEGFVEGVKAHWLKGSYPQIVVSWWPSAKDIEAAR